MLRAVSGSTRRALPPHSSRGSDSDRAATVDQPDLDVVGGGRGVVRTTRHNETTASILGLAVAAPRSRRSETGVVARTARALTALVGVVVVVRRLSCAGPSRRRRLGPGCAGRPATHYRRQAAGTVEALSNTRAPPSAITLCCRQFLAWRRVRARSRSGYWMSPQVAVGTRRYNRDASERMTLSRCLRRYLARHPGNRTSPRTVPQGKSRQVMVTCK